MTDSIENHRRHRSLGWLLAYVLLGPPLLVLLIAAAAVAFLHVEAESAWDGPTLCSAGLSASLATLLSTLGLGSRFLASAEQGFAPCLGKAMWIALAALLLFIPVFVPISLIVQSAYGSPDGDKLGETTMLVILFIFGKPLTMVLSMLAIALPGSLLLAVPAALGASWPRAETQATSPGRSLSRRELGQIAASLLAVVLVIAAVYWLVPFATDALFRRH